MSAIRVAEFVEPLKARTIAVFAGTSSAVVDRLQPAIARSVAISRPAADVVSAFLTPTAVVAFALAIWRLGDDMGWTGEFPVASGLFSHWLVWLALALGIQMSGRLLHRSERAVESKRQ